MREWIKKLWHWLRERATEWVLGGVAISLTGLAPEHWLAQLFDLLNIHESVLHLWAAGIDVRVIPVTVGIGIICIGLLRAPRTLRASADSRSNLALAVPINPALATTGPTERPRPGTGGVSSVFPSKILSGDANQMPAALISKFLAQKRGGLLDSPCAPLLVLYSHNDEQWLRLLVKMLRPYSWFDNIVLCSDEEIKAERLERPELELALRSASVVVLMVSANFLASAFVTRIGLPSLLLDVESQDLDILWILVSNCLYEGTDIARYENIFDPGRPLDSLRPLRRNSALTEIARKIVARGDLNAGSVASRPAGKRPFPAGQLIDAHTPQIKPSTTATNASVLQVHPPEIEVNYREDTEAKGEDHALQIATKMQFIALTYNTLRAALTKAIERLPEVHEIELAIYALPMLRDWHPTLRKDWNQLRREWTTGLTDVLTVLLRRDYCPKLRRLRVRLINRVPTLTASILTMENGSGSSIRIRYTPVLEDEEPASTPTITITGFGGRQDFPNPVFGAYARIVNNMLSKASPLTFVVAARGGSSNYELTQIKEFVDRLALVCNNPKYDVTDALFNVELKIGQNLAEKISWHPIESAEVPQVTPDTVYQAFDTLRNEHRTDELRVTMNSDTLTCLFEVAASDGPCYTASVTGRHIIGAFALLAHGSIRDRAVILRDKQKPPWQYDVPGGKVTTVDTSLADAISREVFEELGLLIETERLSSPISVKYDWRSQKEGVPVIAIYCNYELTPEEICYLENYGRMETGGTDIGFLTSYGVEDLIAKKKSHRVHRRDVDDAEAECHAPLEAIQELLKSSV
jgi:hypothetical protein